MSNLFIPSKIKVGFEKRDDTFTGKLAYVIYFDEKGKLRKETSWENWRDKKIEPIEFENKPNAGYLFNKGVQRGGYHWGSGRSSIRVYDPRDFEFEISVDNLMGILMHSDVSKRDIVEECVFAWEGKELILLPVNSEEYQQSVKYTKKQGGKLSAKELVQGYSYDHKKIDEPLIYVGYYEWFDWDYAKYSSVYAHSSAGKKHVFYNADTKEFMIPLISAFSGVNTSIVVDNYAEVVDEFFSHYHSQPIVGSTIVPFERDEKDHYFRLQHIENEKINQIQFGFYSYHLEEGQVPTTNFENADYNASQYELIYKNRETIQKEKENRYSHYDRKGPGKNQLKLEKSAGDLGFDSKKLTIEETFKVTEAAGYGRLAFVLENGKISKSPKDNYHF
jgi:hypothetical protein